MRIKKHIFSSMDKSSRDFGYGWSFDYNGDMKKDIDENITLTLPDGRRETFMQDLNLVGSWMYSYLDYHGEPGVMARLYWRLDDYVTGIDEQDLVTRDNVTYHYRDGELEYIVLRDDNAIVYSEEGVLSTATGLGVIFYRDPVGRVVRAVASDGTTFEYEYDGRGDLVKVIDPVGNETEYAYDDEHNLIESPEFGSRRGILPRGHAGLEARPTVQTVGRGIRGTQT